MISFLVKIEKLDNKVLVGSFKDWYVSRVIPVPNNREDRNASRFRPACNRNGKQGKANVRKSFMLPQFYRILLYRQVLSYHVVDN